jgi:hypothetical protein
MLTDYEQQRFDELQDWLAESPGWGTRLLAKPGGQAAKAVQALVPVEALRAALNKANQFALRLSDERALLRRAGVESPEALRQLGLEACDRLAQREIRRAMMIGGAGGALFGIAGAAGLVMDVPSLLTLALRTIHRVSLCYGEGGGPAERQRRAIGIFALASANSAAEKQAAWAALRQGRPLLADPGAGPERIGEELAGDFAWREGIERVAEREMAKEATVFSLQTLAGRVGVHLGSRKSAGAVPILGAAVGSAMNAWYLHDVSRTARFVLHDRWLHARGAATAAEPGT